MIGKTAAAIITAALLSASIPSSHSGNHVPEPTIPAREASLPPDSGVATTYMVKLDDESVYLNELDSEGTVLSQKKIDYINIYTLYPAQLEHLREGAIFDKREDAAEFIQDLGS
ncbi:MAG: hypothetical protein IKW02_03990 [Clostridia bacterium]|nr:hypothetical protein [Clostridia bacterium]